ncbi:amidohydrolase family protein [Falsiroseomonas oryzae]|uniref:amidohydrolase family protein n=1 Tax=Falsiroseomonas oryzae TaxID=2766473 RepID=UPI0022EB0E06|nr:amidohydrolase family protein [Roseomonas sp. MO-31]
MHPLTGAVDCDLHPDLPPVAALLPYLEGHWADAMVERGIESLETASYPPNVPLAARPDRRPLLGTGVAGLAGATLDAWGLSAGILNPLLGVHLVFNQDMAVALARALNEWIAREWLDRDARLRASIVVPLQSVPDAVEEIERRAADPRFVQVLVPAMWEVPYGRRSLWPVWEAAARHRLPVGIHAGSAYRHPPTSLGWPSYYAEDYAAQSLGFQSQVGSLITEGVFQQIPDLTVVLIESGVTWLPSYLWRLAKFWRGVRSEVPWLAESPAAVARRHIRLTTAPFDAPEDADTVGRLMDQLGSEEMLLFASDWPHWQWDGAAPPLPAGIPPALAAKLTRANPRSTYPRLAAEVPA